MSEFTPFQLEGLRVHNEHRRKHSVPDLKLSKRLCQTAQNWVNNVASWGALQHSTYEQRGGTGENLYGGNRCFNNSPVDLAKAATDAWYNEVQYWNYNSGGFSMNTGHFTQVVWKATTELGIATARGQMGDFVCANYNPSGNFAGQFQANVPRPVPKPVSAPEPAKKEAKSAAPASNNAVDEESSGSESDSDSEEDVERHLGVVCDGCNAKMSGLRSKCMTCPDFDLCKSCLTSFAHEHKDFWKITLYSPRVTSSRTPWVAASSGTIPRGSLVAGDGGPNGCDVYIARATLKFELLPGKFLPTHQVAYVPWKGKENPRDSYETLVLDPSEVNWVASKDGEIVAGAVVGGISKKGEIFYIGRVTHRGETVVGRVQHSSGNLVFPYGGREIACTEYELLVLKDD